MTKLFRSLVSGTLTTVAIVSSVWVGWSWGADRGQPGGRGDYVFDSLHAPFRTGFTQQCVRTGVPDAGRRGDECDEQVARVPEFVTEAEPAGMIPVPPMTAAPEADDRISEPVLFYEEEPTPERDSILSRRTNANFSDEVAAAEADMARAEIIKPAEPARTQPPANVAAVATATRLPPRITLEVGPNFKFDRAELTPSGKAKLDTFLSELGDVEYQVITVVGHTDRLGAKPYNELLSQRRANAVRAYLVGRKVDQNKIKAEGVGSTQPVTPADACNGLNRRKLIECLQPDRRVEVNVVGTSVEN